MGGLNGLMVIIWLIKKIRNTNGYNCNNYTADPRKAVKPESMEFEEGPVYYYDANAEHAGNTYIN